MLFECLQLIKGHRIKISHIDEVLLRLEANEDIFPVIPLDKDAFETIGNVNGAIKNWDLMILSIALQKEAMLITKDKIVRKANVAKTL